MPDPAEHQVVLAFDFGLRRIGVAVGQAITGSATPLTILTAQAGIPKWEEIAKLVATWQADALVVGLPYQMDGSEQTMSVAARKFARRLEAQLRLPVYLMDERLTSREAELQLKTQELVDSFAAKLILEDWFKQIGEHSNGPFNDD